jgi:hypothetical protein
MGFRRLPRSGNTGAPSGQISSARLRERAAESAPCCLSLVGRVEFPEDRFDGVGVAPCFVIEPCLDEILVNCFIFPIVALLVAELVVGAALTWISQTYRCIGAENLRKMLCCNSSSEVQESPDADRVYAEAV